MFAALFGVVAFAACLTWLGAAVAIEDRQRRRQISGLRGRHAAAEDSPPRVIVAGAGRHHRPTPPPQLDRLALQGPISYDTYTPYNSYGSYDQASFGFDQFDQYDPYADNFYGDDYWSTPVRARATGLALSERPVDYYAYWKTPAPTPPPAPSFVPDHYRTTGDAFDHRCWERLEDGAVQYDGPFQFRNKWGEDHDGNRRWH